MILFAILRVLKKGYVKSFSQIPVFTAPENATRVEGHGANMKCYIDYYHTIIEDLDLTEEKDEGLKLSK